MKKNIAILDVDGVIFDSNTIKENNIKQAAQEFMTDSSRVHAFIEYFTAGNGVPRETKIDNYFKEQKEIGHKILQRYNQLNHENLYSSPFTQGALKSLKLLSNSYDLIALSGGATQEIQELFRRNEISHLFQHIWGGPRLKTEYIQEMPLKNIAFYVGDGLFDYQTAKEFDIPFFFMYSYTQVSNWGNLMKKQGVQCVENLEELTRILLKN